MASVDIESTLTDRYQTTIPESVRRALKLGKRDKIHYAIRPGGEVLLSRAPVDDMTRCSESFSSFLHRTSQCIRSGCGRSMARW